MECHLPSGSALEKIMKILYFTGHCINRFLYRDLEYCRTDNCDFQEFLCTVTCIKYLLLPYLYDKQQRQLILNHIESKCYYPYNLLPDNGRPFEVYVSILPIQFLLLTWGEAIGARKMDWLPSASGAELLVTYSRA